jgi:hypothetical protein
VISPWRFQNSLRAEVKALAFGAAFTGLNELLAALAGFAEQANGFVAELWQITR